MFVCAQQAAQQAGLDLRKEPDGLVLSGDGMTLRVDFLQLLPRIRADKLSRELLVRAARIKGREHPLAIDATAGLGEDSFLLAAAGFDVVLYEQDPVIAELLRDALFRAKQSAELQIIANRMTCIEGDSIQALHTLHDSPDVVVLDPMFPERTKSAAVKKKFQLLHKLERPCSDEAALLSAAYSAHPKKIVIKRPAKGPFLAGTKPSYSLRGKAIRYDVVVPPSFE